MDRILLALGLWSIPVSSDAWQVIGISAIVVMALCGAIYAGLRYELRRQARNIHSLRSDVQTVIISLAAHGIVIRRDDDERS